MKSNLHVAIVLGLGVVLSGVLYSLPKTVVKDKGTETKATTPPKDTHKIILSVTARVTVDSLKSLAQKSANKANLQIAIGGYFAKESLYDSAAWYYEQAAKVVNTPQAWSNTADTYYQAFSMSLDPIERERLAEQTRSSYNKVLEKVPNDLHSKTNIAMTYVSSESPMQAIMMLRQVLAEDPKYIPAMMSMGGLSLQSGQYDKAASRFEEVLKLDSQNINAKIGLAYAQIELGDKQKARILLEEVLKSPLGEVLAKEVSNTLKSLK